MNKSDKRLSDAYLHDLRAALGQDGCPVCRLVATRAERYLEGVLWELVQDIQVRAELNEARGYCNRHAWMLVRSGSALGVAILTNGIVKTLLDVLDSPRGEDSPPSMLDRLSRRDSARGAKLEAELSPQRRCPACVCTETVEEHIILSLVSHLTGPEAIGELYRASDGLCLAHFRQALCRARVDTDAEALVDAQRSVWERLHGELAEFIRKNDCRFRGEGFGGERDSWLRALESISGPPATERSKATRVGFDRE